MNRLLRATPLALAAFALFAPPATAADPTTADCLAANDKSISLRNEHKLLAARAQLLVCAAASCPADIRKECTRRIDQVNASVPTVVFEAKDGSGNDLTAVKVKMDGEILVERLEGSAISLDPGAHTFMFETAGQATITKQLVVREGQKDRREPIQFGAPPSAALPTPLASAVAPTPMAVAPVAETPSSGLGAQKTVALVALGVGVVGLGVGTMFGLQSMSKHNEAADACPAACTSQSGVDLWDQARSRGNLATIGFAVGGVGLVGGALLWFTAGSERANVRVGVGPGAIELRGTY